MSRPTRSRQLPFKLAENYVVGISGMPTKPSKPQIKTTNLHPTKGSNNKISNTYVPNTLSSPVLRDRTNLIKEPTTKLDVLKKGLEKKDGAEMKKMVTEERIKRTRATKLTTNQNRENTQGNARVETKRLTRATNKDVKISEKAVPMVSITDIGKPGNAVTKKVQKDTIEIRSTKKSTINKSTEVETKSSTGAASKLQLRVTRRKPTSTIDVSNNKSKSPSKKVSDEESKVSTKLTVTHKTIGNQSVKRSTRLSKNNVSIEPNNKNEGKKFFKSKLKSPKVVSTHLKILPLKRPIASKTGKTMANQRKANKIPASKLSTSFRLRQPTLSEAFANQPKKVLRPRKELINYVESQVNDEKVNENKLGNIDKKKGPVYKLEENKGDDNTNKEKIYDFVFDSNDSKERVTKKRRKRIVRKQPTKKAKLLIKSPEIKPTLSNKLPTIKVDEIVKPKPPLKKNNDVNMIKDDNKITTVTALIHLPPPEISDKDNGEPLVDQVQEPITDRDANKRLRIISNENIPPEHRIRLTTTPTQSRANGKDSISTGKLNMLNLRPSMQMKTMMNAPLLRRSISPITNVHVTEHIDTGSPWRTPVINTFSRVKNIFQSTPQSKQLTNLLGKVIQGTGAIQKLQGSKLNKIAENNDENANVSLTKKSPEKIQTNTSKSPRKFGTVISNINNISPIKQLSVRTNTSKSPRKFGTVISNINETSNTNLITNERTKLTSIVEQSSIIGHSMNTMWPDIDEISQIPDETLNDKENLAPSKTPKKSPQKNIIPSIISPSLENNHTLPESKLTDEVLEPQAGPSGLQKQSPLTDAWNLKQTNLNKFLNLPDMPESTQINTAHGIFSDSHGSTSIIGKPIRKIPTELPNVHNAFGFDNDDDDDDNNIIEMSPINKIDKKLETEKISPENKLNNKVPTIKEPLRFPVVEFKKTLLPIKEVENKQIDKKQEKNDIDRPNDKFISNTKKDIIHATDFSDTFDNIDHEIDDENIKEVPLFVDVEPVHFTQPPRYSYAHKRKRSMSLSTSGELEDDETDEHQKLKKKKRLRKADRKQKQELDQWAKNMNNTFEEIEHFDLFVE
ncbi:hypothetical protein PV327_000823 [Microctonus hyperodae]|uniref:Uncharacterized protein n=1 Tax=Microctonus hyperodae TaxID=165561 RepID=A0AA39G6Z0_MICHY|nr:hypothetical protein PV327_000823 [Microctonus hyperodae]